jgi:hypothetical protein
VDSLIFVSAVSVEFLRLNNAAPPVVIAAVTTPESSAAIPTSKYKATNGRLMDIVFVLVVDGKVKYAFAVTRFPIFT